MERLSHQAIQVALRGHFRERIWPLSAGPNSLVPETAGTLVLSMAPSAKAPQDKRKKSLYWACPLSCLVLLLLSGALALSFVSFWLGDSSYATYAEVGDSRLKACLPPGATEIRVHKQLNGHLARYRVSEAELQDFLDGLWQAKGGNSAHEREQMSGEGKVPQRERFVQRFGDLGWEPLENALLYHSPSKSSGAMTTYYFDRDTGLAYHDTGYW